MAKSLRTKTGLPSCGIPTIRSRGGLSNNSALVVVFKQVEWSQSVAKGDPCCEISLTGWSSPPNQRPPASPQPPPPGQQAVTIGEPWQRRRPIPRTSCLTNSLYKLLAICQFLSNRCLIATSFHARLVKLQSACGPARRFGPVRWLANVPKLLGCGDAPDHFFLDRYPQNCSGLLPSAPLNFQAKSPEQAFRSGVWCRDFSAYRTLNTRIEHNNRRGRSRNAVYDMGTNLNAYGNFCLGAEHRRDGRSRYRMRDVVRLS